MIGRIALLGFISGSAFAQTPTLVKPYYIKLNAEGTEARQAACSIEYKGIVLAAPKMSGTNVLESKGKIKLNAGINKVQLRCQVNGYRPVSETLEIGDKGLIYEQCLSTQRLFQKTVVDLEKGVAHVRLAIPQFHRETVNIDGKKFTRLTSDDPEITSGSYSGKPHMPEFPQTTFYLALPLDAEITGLEVKSGKTTESITSLLVPKIDEGTPDLVTGIKPQFDDKIYFSEKPVVMASRDSQYTAVIDREKNLVKVSAPLVDFSVSNQKIRFFNDMTIAVQFKATSKCFRAPFQGRDAIDRYRAQKLVGLKQLILNPSDIQTVCRSFNKLNEDSAPVERMRALISDRSVGPNMVIVSPPEFREQAEALRIHKETLGIRTVVLDWSQGTAADLKALLEKLSGSYRPNYMQWILLLGDVDLIPTYYDRQGTVNYDKAMTAGDIYYTQYGSTPENYTPSQEPDISIGRIPAKNIDELQVVVSRIIQYENKPPLMDYYYQTPTIAGTMQMNGSNTTGMVGNYAEFAERNLADKFFQAGLTPERIFRADRPNVLKPEFWSGSNLIDYPTLTAPQPQMPSLLFHMDGSQELIDAAMQRGTSLLFHRGHGNIDRWMVPSYTYDAQRFSGFPDSMPPVVMAVSCLTGFFDSETIKEDGHITHPSSPLANTIPDQHYLAESMLLSPNGALGVVASSRQSTWGYNDRLTKGLARSLAIKTNSENLPLSQRLGDVMVDAKVFAKTFEGAIQPSKEELEPANRHHLLTYNLLGDPSVEVRQSLPLLVRNRPSTSYDSENSTLRIRFKLESIACPACDLQQQPDQPIAVLMNEKNQVISRAFAYPIISENGENREVILTGVTNFYNALQTIYLSHAGVVPYPLTIDNRVPVLR